MIFNPETFRELDLEPVRAAARLFREYVQMHADKFEPFGQSAEEHAAITAKCERNANAADSLEKWLATHAQEIAGLVEENARQTKLLRRVLAYVPSTFGVTQDIRAALERKPHD